MCVKIPLKIYFKSKNNPQHFQNTFLTLQNTFLTLLTCINTLDTYLQSTKLEQKNFKSIYNPKTLTSNYLYLQPFVKRYVVYSL